MCRSVIIVFVCGLLMACISLDKNSESGEFYTWVDERGQLQTLKRSDKSNAVNNENRKVEVKKTLSTSSSRDEVSSNQVDIAESDYTPSIEIDKKLSGMNLFSWNQDGRQEIIITEKIVRDGEDQPPNIDRIKPLRDFSRYREGNQVPFSDLVSKGLDLSNYYILNKRDGSDYMLIEIDFRVNAISIQSFIHKNKVALPVIDILDANYYAGIPKDFFTSYSPETWSSYGYFDGKGLISPNAAYILIRPNPLLGVIETASGDVTVSNLGRLLIKVAD